MVSAAELIAEARASRVSRVEVEGRDFFVRKLPAREVMLISARGREGRPLEIHEWLAFGVCNEDGSAFFTAEEAAEYLLTKKGALESALWFWGSRNLNAVADTGDVVKLTKIINGGDIGLADRQARYAKAMAVLTGSAPVAAAPSAAASSGGSLRVGSKGEDVQRVQKALGIAADGDFGPGTERAVKAWQSANGLTPDGVVGPKTLAKLIG